MADNSLQYLQGEAVDWACTEISVDGQPFSAGFTSLDWSTLKSSAGGCTRCTPDPKGKRHTWPSG